MSKRKFSVLELEDITGDKTDGNDPSKGVSKKRKRVKKKRNTPVDDRNGVKEGTPFPHLWIMYSRNFREELPHSHPLDMTGNDFLPSVFQSVLDIDCGVSVSSISVERLLNCQYLVNIFVKMAHLWQKNRKNMNFVVNAHCGKEVNINSRSEFTDRFHFSCDDMTRLVDIMGRFSKKTEGVSDQQNRNEESGEVLSCVSWKNVFTLLIHVVHRLVPLDLWGPGGNRASFFKNLKNFLKLGRYDVIYIGDVMQNIHPTHCSWAKEFKTFFEKVNIVTKVFLWVLKHIIMIILYSYFYITETGFKRFQVVYMKKSVWQSNHDHAVWTMIKDGRMRKLSNLEARKFNKVLQQNCLNNRDLKLARLRFLPKIKGVRPIIPARNSGLTKLQISNAKRVLGEMIKVYSHGSKSVRALPKLHEAWQTFVSQRRAAKDTRPLYFVKVDVKDAYGSILQEKMMSLITEQYLRLGPKLGFSQYGVVGLSGQVGKKRLFIPLDACGRPTEPLSYGSQPLLEVSEPIWINTKNVFKSLRLAVMGQLVRNGQSQYLVTRGISQGGALSSLLCELYYSSMCCYHLMQFSAKDSILLRSVDDFLYVTPHQALAVSFLKTMKNGIKEYNCSINELKTQTNLDTDEPVQVVFTGSILCSDTCEVLIDVSSLQNVGFRYSMRLNQYHHRGNFFAKKLFQVSVAKMAPLYVDPLYNSLSGAVSNVWRNSLLAAGRFVAMMEILLEPRGSLNVGFLVRTALTTAKKMYTHLMRACAHDEVTQPLSKSCVVGCYTLALFTMLKVRRKPKWSNLLMCLRGLLPTFISKISEQERCLIPYKALK